MIFNTEHAFAAIAIALLAYQLGKAKGATAVPTADTNIQNPQQWWNYASSWSV